MEYNVFDRIKDDFDILGVYVASGEDWVDLLKLALGLALALPGEAFLLEMELVLKANLGTGEALLLGCDRFLEGDRFEVLTGFNGLPGEEELSFDEPEYLPATGADAQNLLNTVNGLDEDVHFKTLCLILPW
jgi:hypothetical protein